MERLVTTTQAAQILGLSLQGVHYRIKQNQLKSIKKSGKTYVYISEHVEDKSKSNEVKPVEIVEIREILKAKDEQIELLKKSMKWMKKQYNSEIIRLEKNQKKIIDVFNREVELLQSAFNEMRSIYKPKLEQKTQAENTNIKKQKNEKKYLTILEFTKLMKKYKKSDIEIKYIILNAINSSDERFIYEKSSKNLLILNTDFRDLVDK